MPRHKGEPDTRTLTRRMDEAYRRLLVDHLRAEMALREAFCECLPIAEEEVTAAVDRAKRERSGR